MDQALFSFFGLRENPFNVNPDPRFLFLTPQTQTALADLIEGVQARKGLILLTGEVGTGKTTLVNCLLNLLQRQGIPRAFIFNSHLEPRELFELMLSDFQITADAGSARSALSRLNNWLVQCHRTGGTAVLIVDEAQGLPSHTLEEIRLLLNLETQNGKLLQIILSGQSELEDKLKRLDLREIRQRIALRCKSMPMRLDETRACIEHRLHVAGANGEPVFSPEAIDAVHFYSTGIPRVMNLLCEHALRKAHGSGVRLVAEDIVDQVACEFQFDGDRPRGQRPRPAAVASANLITMPPISVQQEQAPAAFAAAVGFNAPLTRTPLREVAEFPRETEEAARRVSLFATSSVDTGSILASSEPGAPRIAVPNFVHPTGTGSASAPALKLEQTLPLTQSAPHPTAAFPLQPKSARLLRSMLSSLQTFQRWFSRRLFAAVLPRWSRASTALFLWLRQPIRPQRRLKSHAGAASNVSEWRSSAAGRKLAERTLPLLRWLQAPSRPAHRH